MRIVVDVNDAGGLAVGARLKGIGGRAVALRRMLRMVSATSFAVPWAVKESSALT